VAPVVTAVLGGPFGPCGAGFKRRQQQQQLPDAVFAVWCGVVWCVFPLSGPRAAQEPRYHLHAAVVRLRRPRRAHRRRCEARTHAHACVCVADPVHDCGPQQQATATPGPKHSPQTAPAGSPARAAELLACACMGAADTRACMPHTIVWVLSTRNAGPPARKSRPPPPPLDAPAHMSSPMSPTYTRTHTHVHAHSTLCAQVPRRLYFGRLVGCSDRGVTDRYSLRRRPYLGPTSMDAEMGACACVCACRQACVCVC
jgi:hypothetical protein